MIVDQLVAKPPEFFKIRVRRVCNWPQFLVGESEIAIKVELPKFPAGIFEQRIAPEIVGADAGSIRTIDHHLTARLAPTKLPARIEAGIQLLAGARTYRPAVNLFYCSHLRGRQAIR